MSRRGWLLFALLGVIWGVPYLMIKVAVDGVSVPVLVFVRTAVGAVVLLPLVLGRGRLSGLRPHLLPMAAFAALEIIVPWWLLSDAERELTSSMTGLLIAASPIAAVVIARLAGSGEWLSVARWAGLAVGLAGVAVLAAPELTGGNPWSITEVLLAALCYATAPLIVVRRLKDVPALPMTAVCLGFAALVYAPPAIATWPDALPPGQVLAALAGLAIGCTALGFLVFFALIREVGTSRALVFTYVNPAVAVTAGVLILGEPLTVPIVVSFALILVGSVLATASQREHTGAPQAGPEAAAASTGHAVPGSEGAEGERVPAEPGTERLVVRPPA